MTDQPDKFPDTAADQPGESPEVTKVTEVTDKAEPSSETDAAQEESNARRRWIGRGLLVVGVLLLLSAGWVGWRTYQAYRHLSTAADQVSALQTQVQNLDTIDVTKTDAAVQALRHEADDAVSATSDPLYRLASHLPWAGPNLRAISDIANTVDSLATTTAPGLLDVARTAQPSSLAPKGGVIDLSPITQAGGTLQAADTAVKDAQARTAAIDRSSLVGPVASAVDKLQQKLGKLSATTGTAARIGRLAPAMLGSTGTRRYLIAFQNLAEPRATGGIFGSYAILQIQDGKLSIVDQGSSSRDLGEFTPPLALPAGLSKALYGTLPGQYATDANLTPDFPTAAAMLAQMYQTRKKTVLDGVLALDPVALSYLLSGSKPIDVGHGVQLTSANIAAVLMSKAYQLFPNASDAPARDLFLETATAKAFDTVTNSAGNATTLVKGLSKAATQHRLLLWSAHPAEQTDLAATELAGGLPTADGDSPTVGLYRNDGTGGKLGYYAGGSVTLTPGSCTTGRRALTLTATLTYDAPTKGLSEYVLGFAKAGPYVLRTNVMVFAPLTGDLTAIIVNGKSVPVLFSSEHGRKVGVVTVDLRPGEQAKIVGSLTVAAASGSNYTPQLALTPGVKAWSATADPFAGC